MAKSEWSPPFEQREKRKPDYHNLVPLFYAPALPLIRIALNKRVAPGTRDIIFGAALLTALAHAGYVMSGDSSECNAFLVLTVPLEYLNKLITIVGLSPRTVQSRAPSDSVLGPARLEVFAGKATKSTRKPIKTQPQLLSRIEELKLLSQIEKSGLLSRLEKQGITLSKIEEAGLLSKAENLGLLSAASSPTTPTLLYTLAVAAIALGAGIVYIVPDTSFGEVAGQLVGAGALIGAGAAALYGANLLSSLQKSI